MEYLWQSSSLQQLQISGAIGYWADGTMLPVSQSKRDFQKVNIDSITNTRTTVYWSLFGVVIISIVLLSMSDKTSAEFVFTNYDNETGWSDGMAWILGLLQSALSLIAFDVVLHMTEEMPNPSRDAPRAMLYSIVIGGVT